MPSRRKKDKLQQLMEFKQGRIFGLREGWFSYCTIAAGMQQDSSKVMQVWKQWTDDHRTIRKAGSGQRKVTSVHENRYLFRMAVNDRTASWRQSAVRCSTATGVLKSASSICRRLLHRWLHEMVPIYGIPLSANHRR